MQRKTKIALGIILLPFVIALFVIDRAICLPLFWLDNYSFKKWSDKDNEVFYSLLRLIALGVLLTIYTVSKWIFL